MDDDNESFKKDAYISKAVSKNHQNSKTANFPSCLAINPTPNLPVNNQNIRRKILIVNGLNFCCILMFYLISLDTCFLENQVFSFNQNHECVKMGTPQQCQLACKQTNGCSKFSYFSKYFKGSNNVDNDASRESLDCCLLTDTDAPGIATKKQYAVSGPKFCASEKAAPSNNYFRDIFSGKTIKCENVLAEILLHLEAF